MSFDSYPARASEEETYTEYVQFTGNGAANPTVNFGRNIASIVWVSTGLYTITFVDSPGNFVGPDGGAGFTATTPSQLAGYDCTFGLFDSTGKIIQVSITNSTFALANLTSTQSVCLPMVFKRMGKSITGQQF